MLTWTKTPRGNYISSFDYQNTSYKLQVYANGVYKIVKISYKINIVGRTEPYNQVIAQGFCGDVFKSMSLAEKNLKNLLQIRDSEFSRKEEKVITEEKVEQFKNAEPELFEQVKEEIEEEIAPKCTTPTIGLVDTEIGTYITITGDPDDEIRFTINNKSVGKTSKLYRKPFLLKEGMIIKAKAFNVNKKDSETIKYVNAQEE